MKKVAYVESSSKPGIFYPLSITSSGDLFCECPDFGFRKKLGQKCKHANAFLPYSEFQKQSCVPITLTAEEQKT